jgi:hypothetical protein
VLEEDTNQTPNKSADERSISYLLKWIKAAKKGAKEHWEATKVAYAEFNRDIEKMRGKDNQELIDGYYPIYHSSVKTIESAYYARTPKLNTERLWDSSDEIAIRRSTILERLGGYLLKYSNIDDAMRAAVADFIHGDKATLQVHYDADKTESFERVPLIMQQHENQEPVYVENDEEYTGQEDVQEDDEGAFYNKPKTDLSNQRIYLSPLCFDEVIHDPEAKTESEINMKAYKFCLSWDEAVTRFTEEKLKGCENYFKTISAFNETRQEDDAKPQAPGKFLQGWEVYDKKTNKIYWVCEDYSARTLDTKDYALGLEGFFPSPKFRISSKPPKSLYPTPEFVHLAPLINQLHELQGKMFRGIKTIERKVLVDGAEKDIITLLESGSNVSSIIEKGGISNLIQDVPVAAFVQALTEFTSLKSEFKNEFFEHFGVPDILRGISDAMETAAAQEIKQGAAYDRFRYNKKMMVDLARDAVEMMIDMALGVYDDQKIAQIVGGNIQDPSFIEDLQFLRNDTERSIRIGIETDSTNFVNEQQQVNQKNQIISTLVNGMQQISGMLGQGQPEYAAVSLHALTSLLDSMPGGKSYVQEMKGYTQQLIQKAMQPPEPQPPPPDYEALKVQVQNAEVQRKIQKDQMDAQRDRADIEQKSFKLTLDQQQQAFDQQISSAMLGIEQLKAQVAALNTAADNRRLEAEAVTQPIAPTSQPTSQPITIHLNNDTRVKKKKYTVLRTAAGLVGESEEVPTVEDALGAIVNGNV